MAANTRVNPGGWAQGDLLTPAQINALDTMAAGCVKRASTATGWRMMPLMYIGSTSNNGSAADTHYFSAGVLYLDPSATAKKTFWALSLPHGHTLTTVRVYLAPSVGHGGEVAVKPAIEVSKTAATGVVSSLGTTTYTWSNVATYEAGVYLDVAPAAEVIDNANYRYHVSVTCESGANALVLALAGIDVYVTIDSANGGPDLKFWP